MKAIVCEMCGSNDLVKKDGLYVCQQCGTKYSVEEAKKMMVEIEGKIDVSGSKVEIDKKSELDNYYIIARRAIDNRDFETAEKYYDMILQIEPNSYEAVFYKAYCNACNCKIIQIRSSIIQVNNCLDSVYSLMKKSLKGKELEEKIIEISNAANSVFIMLVNAYKKHYEGISLSIIQQYAQEKIDTLAAGRDAEEYMVALLQKYFPESEWVKKNVPILLSNANTWHIDFLPLLKDKEGNLKVIHERTARIQQYNPDYKEPISATTSNGCYVATCVYGSYDCPEVWTLRRFRDNYLDNFSLGRAFIKIYYAISPKIVKKFGNNKCFRKTNKWILDKFVVKLNNDGYENTRYNDKY